MLSNFSTCKSPAVAEMGDSLATIDMNKKVEAAVPLSMGKLGPHVTNVAWAEAYLRTKWHLDLSSRLATTDIAYNTPTSQTDRQTTVRYHRAKRFTNGRP